MSVMAPAARQPSRPPNETPAKGLGELDVIPVIGSIALRPDPAAKVKPALEIGPLRVAVLLNSYRSRLLPAIRGSYQRTIGAVAPHAQLAFYEPANRPGDFPNPDYFDLIVLGGSNVDPRKRYPWILEVHEFVRRMVRDYPHKKLVGICWGHQTISSVFGGKLADAPVPEVSRIPSRPVF